jgi:prepilin-type N-terminal cleavage/methylation domain-containing protein/prepilin-type processing-associated H-X9-DG protein
MARERRATGFTLIELLAVIAIAAVLVVVLLIPWGRARSTGPGAMKDSTQVRGMQQSMAIWANMNKGLYPLPSMIDTANTTVADQGTAKDTTANIYSLLIYTGGISVDLAISPAESNTAGIAQDDDYMFDLPKAAVSPANALWDPAFSADFTGGHIGNTSYAHVMPGGTRASLWRDTFTTTEPVVGNRGPEVSSLARDAAGNAVPTFVLANSNTFLIHGTRNAWEGNIAYNDGHVSFETRLDPTGTTYKDAAGKSWTDCLFYDEPDDPAGTNAFMSIWTKAGSTNAAFKGIWD